MRSLAWPKMFRNNEEVKLVADKEATKSNLLLLLNSDRVPLFGDPYFGTSLKPLLFEQNNTILVDLLVEEICAAIAEYMPQISVTRNDIKIYTNKTDLIATVKVTYKADNTTDLYDIRLMNDNQEG